MLPSALVSCIPTYARRDFRQALHLKPESPNIPLRYDTESLLGAALAGQKKFEEAEEYLKEGYLGLKRIGNKSSSKGLMPAALDRLIDFYDAWGKPEEADKWRKDRPTKKEK